jgi:hypothetical protein
MRFDTKILLVAFQLLCGFLPVAGFLPSIARTCNTLQHVRQVVHDFTPIRARVVLFAKAAKEVSMQEVEADASLVKSYEGDEYMLLKEEYKMLINNGKPLNFATFLKNSNVAFPIKEGRITKELVEEIWLKYCPNKLNTINVNQFIAMNLLIDEHLASTSKGDYDDEENGSNEDYDGDEEPPIVVTPGLDPFDPQVKIEQMFIPEYTDYISRVFGVFCHRQKPSLQTKPIANLDELFEAQSEVDETDKSGWLSWPQLMQWDDMQMIMQESQLDNRTVIEAWQSAVEYQMKTRPYKGPQDVTTKHVEAIDYETFIRFNYRVEELISALAGLSEYEEGQESYRDALQGEFDNLAQNRTVVPFETLMKWDYIQEILKLEYLNEEDLKTMWEELPKEKEEVSVLVEKPKRLLKIPAKEPKMEKVMIEGINFNSFLLLNSMIDEKLPPEEDKAEYDGNEEEGDEGDEYEGEEGEENDDDGDAGEEK